MHKSSASILTNNQDQYFGWCRSDILDHVPHDANSILSIGCGAGNTEGELVKRGLHVTGLELDQHAAELARQKGVDVLVGDVQQTLGLLVDKSFDCLIYADILEHLSRPEEVLCHHIKLLKSGGSVIISIPNFRHYRVFWQLFVRGKIFYKDSGIFDRTHLRITTRKLIEHWTEDLGLINEEIDYRIHRRRERWCNNILFKLLSEVLATQVIVVARKS